MSWRWSSHEIYFFMLLPSLLLLTTAFSLFSAINGKYKKYMKAGQNASFTTRTWCSSDVNFVCLATFSTERYASVWVLLRKLSDNLIEVETEVESATSLGRNETKRWDLLEICDQNFCVYWMLRFWLSTSTKQVMRLLIHERLLMSWRQFHLRPSQRRLYNKSRHLCLW